MIKIKQCNFKYEIGTIFEDGKRDIVIMGREIRKRYSKNGEFKCNDKWYKYTCNVCGWTEGWMTESCVKKTGCSCCSGRIVIENINSIYKTDPWMIPYIGEECAKTHTRCSTKRIFPTCPMCGRVSGKTLNIYNIYTHKGVICSCQDGIRFPNKFAFKMLEDLKIDFETEYSPKWINPRAYDFYIPSMNIIIEMDGGFHKKDNNMSGQTKEESKAIDDYKDRLANEHGIEVIRIDCDYVDVISRFEYIKQNILANKILNNLFDLSSINWNKVQEFSLSNLVKEACRLKNENPNITTGQIEKILRYSKNTIRTWLIKGNELGWCIYNSEKEKQISGKISAPAKFKSTICLDNGMVFRSAKECSENSLELFGINIDKTCIGEVCRGKRKQTKGFSFKHIKDLTSEEYIKYDIENKLKEYQIMSY